MNLVFVDETQKPGDNSVLAVCALLVNSTKYDGLVTDFGKALSGVGWSPDEEFKGSYIFSQSKGDRAVSVEKRIKLADSVLSLCQSESNCRVAASVCYNRLGKSTKNYLRLLDGAIKNLAFCKDKKLGKHLAAIYIDFRSDVTQPQLSDVLMPLLTSKGCTLLEDCCVLHSRPRHVGLALVDIIGYITIANHLKEPHDSDMFGGLFATTAEAKKRQLLQGWFDKVKKVRIKELKASAM